MIYGTVVFDGCGNVRAIGGNVASTIAQRLETREFRSGETQIRYMARFLDIAEP